MNMPRSTVIFIRSLLVLLALSAGHSGFAAGPLQVTIADITFPDTYANEQWLTFQRNVEQAAGDDIALKLLITGQLGSEDQLMSGLRRGRVQYASVSALFASTVVPEAALLYGPYLFDSFEEADFIYDRYLTALFTELLAEQGLHFVAWNEVGFHHLYGKQPMLIPDDVAGIRFRVSASRASTLLAQNLKADVIPLGFADIVGSLQTGLIEAGENGATLYATSGAATEAPHLTLTRHAFGVSLIVSAKRWWDQLSNEQREILAATFPSPEEVRPPARAETEEILRTADQWGFSIHTLNEDQLAAWRAATAGTAKTLADEIGGRAPEVYATILAGKRAFRAAQAAKP
jgi:TRAP-type C4-dicarboxylate transport system substrate-binding protein